MSSTRTSAGRGGEVPAVVRVREEREGVARADAVDVDAVERRARRAARPAAAQQRAPRGRVAARRPKISWRWISAPPACGFSRSCQLTSRIRTTAAPCGGRARRARRSRSARSARCRSARRGAPPPGRRPRRRVAELRARRRRRAARERSIAPSRSRRQFVVTSASSSSSSPQRDCTAPHEHRGARALVAGDGADRPRGARRRGRAAGRRSRPTRRGPAARARAPVRVRIAARDRRASQSSSPGLQAVEEVRHLERGERGVPALVAVHRRRRARRACSIVVAGEQAEADRRRSNSARRRRPARATLSPAT